MKTLEALVEQSVVSRSNEERLGAIIFCLDAVCRVVYFEVEQAACKNSRILRTEEFEELLLAWMCSVLEHSTRRAIDFENTYKTIAGQSNKQTTMKKKQRIQYVDSNLTGMRLRNEGRDLHSSRDMFCKGSRPFAGEKIILVKSGTTAYREAKVQSVTCLIQLLRRRPRPPPSPQGVGSSFPFGVPADYMLKYSQPRRVLPCEVKSSLRERSCSCEQDL